MFSKKLLKHIGFWLGFWKSKRRKIDKKIVLKKYVLFEHRILCVFFQIFAILARFWTLPGRPKIDKKSKKSCLGRFWNAFRFLYRFWNGFGKVLGGFGEVLGRVSEGFLRFVRSWRNLHEAFRVAGLALMIRATRSR